MLIKKSYSKEEKNIAKRQKPSVTETELQTLERKIIKANALVMQLAFQLNLLLK